MIIHSKKIKKAAIELRKKGETFSEIQNSLHIKIPKSTLSYWCKKVVLPYHYYDKIELLNIKNRKKGRLKAVISNRNKFQKLIENINKSNGHIVEKIKDKDILKMLLAMLYLGEGAKWKSHRGLHLGSSNPNIIRLYIILLNKCYGIQTKSIKAAICHRADQNLYFLHKYWSKITGISLKNFYPRKPDSRTIGKKTLKKDYKGVCALTCAGTHIQLELESIPLIILKGV